MKHFCDVRSQKKTKICTPFPKQRSTNVVAFWTHPRSPGRPPGRFAFANSARRLSFRPAPCGLHGRAIRAVVNYDSTTCVRAYTASLSRTASTATTTTSRHLRNVPYVPVAHLPVSLRSRERDVQQQQRICHPIPCLESHCLCLILRYPSETKAVITVALQRHSYASVVARERARWFRRVLPCVCVVTSCSVRPGRTKPGQPGMKGWFCFCWFFFCILFFIFYVAVCGALRTYGKYFAKQLSQIGHLRKKVSENGDVCCCCSPGCVFTFHLPRLRKAACVKLIKAQTLLKVSPVLYYGSEGTGSGCTMPSVKQTKRHVHQAFLC